MDKGIGRCPGSQWQVAFGVWDAICQVRGWIRAPPAIFFIADQRKRNDRDPAPGLKDRIEKPNLEKADTKVQWTLARRGHIFGVIEYRLKRTDLASAFGHFVEELQGYSSCLRAPQKAGVLRGLRGGTVIYIIRARPAIGIGGFRKEDSFPAPRNLFPRELSRQRSAKNSSLSTAI